MAAEYFLMAGDQKIGPFTERQILQGIRSGKFSLFDNIFDKQKGAWVMMMQHPDFCDVEMSSNDDYDQGSDHSSADSGGLGLAATEFRENFDSNLDIANELLPELEHAYWYEKNLPEHPLRFLDIVSLLRARKFSEHTLISKSSEGPFRPLIQWDEFSAKSLAEYQSSSNSELPEVTIRRKAQRFDCGKVFIFVADGKAFKAFCTDISRTGMSFVVRTPKAFMDDSLHVKLSETMQDQKFDAKATVVGIRKIRVSESGDVYIRYAIRFTHISESGVKHIAELTKNK